MRFEIFLAPEAVDDLRRLTANARAEVTDAIERHLRHERPAGILVGFASEDEWFEYQLENDPCFLKRIEQARASLRNGQGVRLEDVTTAKKLGKKR